MRLLVVADRPAEVVEPLSRARRARADLAADTEIVLVVGGHDDSGGPSGSTASDVRVVVVDPDRVGDERLEAGLLLRPLPERLVVVGRQPSCSPAQLCLLSTLLDLRPELAAITMDDGRPTSEAILQHGGAFRPGLLVPAGGFVGDGNRSVEQRLAAVGGEILTLPPPVDVASGLSA